MSRRYKRLSDDVEAFWHLEHDENGEKRYLSYKVRVSGNVKSYVSAVAGTISVVVHFDAPEVKRLIENHIAEIFKSEPTVEALALGKIEVRTPHGFSVKADADKVLP